MTIKGLALLFMLFLVSLPMAAHNGPGEVAGGCLAPTQSEDAAGLVEGIDPAPEVGLFVPEPQQKGCFSDCMNEWTSTMCAGLTGDEYQYCVNDGAEGCRCHCSGC